MTSIEAICGEHCRHGNISVVNCNETLSYSCTDEAVAVTYQPIRCVGTNDFNYSTSLCKLSEITTRPTPVTTSCSGSKYRFLVQ